jgi:hypothetical protein
MANPFQQRARQRKIIYLALILALFTGSLLHRRLVVEKQADNLQLRESARGEVEVTGSFVRLSLTGSRALTTTILWSMAVDRMAKHEWNELELLVNSISALQPYFVTPWVFQSWNLAFNVAVECDRPRDKYYYVSRGLELLAEGERRNQGTVTEGPQMYARPTGRPIFPGNPEMRFYMGFYYQLKIGNSDEKSTMRCLLDLSCIDPLERDAKRFVVIDQNGREDIDRQELERFTERHPRLVRRLREQLGYEEPKQIVKFLEDNKDVPGRFKRTVAPGQKESELEIPRKQFPVLPPVEPRKGGVEGPAWPNPESREMTNEALDVFVISRTWYQYCQEPLPPPKTQPGVLEEEQKWQERIERDRQEKGILYRPAKTMAMEIFRSYPGRGQVYVAESLEGEGWFGEGGWRVERWFDRGGGADPDVVVGTETKYQARPAWQEGYRLYVEYGKNTGMYLQPHEEAELDRKAAPVRAKYRANSYDPLPPLPDEWRAQLGASYDAHNRLIVNTRLRQMCNYDANLIQADAERDPLTVHARSLIHRAVRYNRDDKLEAMPLYEQAWPIWIDLGLRYPKFFQINYVQEDVYEPMLKYMRLTYRHREPVFKTAQMTAALMGIAPHPFWPRPSTWQWARWPYFDSQGNEQPMIDPVLRPKLVNRRASRGPLEIVMYYNGPHLAAVREWWCGLTSAAAALGRPAYTPPVLMPEYSLAGHVWDRRDFPPPAWRYLIDSDTVYMVRERIGLIKPREALPPSTPANPQAPPPSPPPK